MYWETTVSRTCQLAIELREANDVTTVSLVVDQHQVEQYDPSFSAYDTPALHLSTDAVIRAAQRICSLLHLES